MGQQRRGKGLGDGGVRELEAGSEEPGGNGAGTGEECFIGHLTQGQAQGKGRRGQHSGAVNGCCQGAGELGISDRVGRGEVDGTGKGFCVQDEEDGGDHVVEADPGHPLPAGAERAAEA